VRDALRIAVELCRQFEGFRPDPYLCPAGVATIGYGTTFYFDGTPVTLKDPPIPKMKAELILINSLSSIYMPAVLKASPSLLHNPDVLGAITDFAYNLGVSRYRASTLRKRIDVQDWERARVELMRWNKADGRVLPGLVLRRAAEAKFFP
jgi:lysozyme